MGLLVAVFVFTAPLTVSGQQGTCINLQTQINQPIANKNKLRKYRTNLSSFPITHLSHNEVVYAVDLAATYWNEQATAGHWKMLRSTTLTDLPPTKAVCDLLGIDYDLVVVLNNDDGGNLGVYEPRCIDNNNVAHHARIVTYRRNANNQDFEWGVGNVSSNEFDLVHNWAHEFGHALGIGHPGSGEIAVMQQTGVSRNRGTNRQRDLYQYDINCAREIAGTRSLSGYRRISSGIDTIGAESMYTGGWSTFFGGVGVTKFDGSWSWSATAGANSSHIWTKDLNTANSWGFVPATTAMWSVPVLFREDPSLNDRAFYSLINETPQYQANAVHSVRYNRSSDGFASASWGDMTYCSAMSTWMTCNGSQAVNTGKRINVAWDSSVGRSQFVWVNQNRLSNSASREILVSTGYINNYTLPQPNSLGVQSNVTPGVVCSSGKANGYDCMVAYVMQNDTQGEVRIRRFSAFIPIGATRYSLDINPHESLIGPNFRTASAITAWYHNGKFFVAIRPLRTITPNEQNIEIVTSSDTVNWSLLKSGNEIGYSAVGPSAVSYWTGANNILGYWR